MMKKKITKSPKRNLGGFVAPFEFSRKDKEKLQAILKGRQNIDQFIEKAREILEIWRHIGTANSDLTKPADLKKVASQIAGAAKKLKGLLEELAEDADDLLGQMLWVVNQRRYPIDLENMAKIRQSIEDLEAAAQEIGNRKRTRSAPTKYADTQAIRLIGDLYKKCFDETPQATKSKTDAFYRLVVICVPNATQHLIRKALSREN